MNSSFSWAVRRYSQNLAATAGGHGGGSSRWRLLSFLTLIPIGACYVNAQQIEKQEHEHWEKHKPEFIPYEHLRLRSKRFPWGDGNHTLFHNKKINALPDGYEE
ncbi:hypothetical protein HELRODRAFT_108466 [Helobdella robusta]|uniref:Cytochrome c oxidase subunit n=1 Tax=Helobdella robusta TaxID=6412 RepID=T1EEJ3_HELRO|nr:hypothetical protein HELRODRAFT_108466 [Helobdella robusta]ESN91711.1 hypothetical protein HELRODRAFT_108466 [Helobdella robusta]